MHKARKLTACFATTSLALVSPVFAGTALGVPMGTVLSAAFPIGEGGLIGLAAAGVVAAIWLAKRKR